MMSFTSTLGLFLFLMMIQKLFCQSCYLDPAYEAQIQRDLLPFKDGITNEMIRKLNRIGYLRKVTIKNHKAIFNSSDPQLKNIKKAFLRLAEELPDMEIFLNLADFPRVFKHKPGPLDQTKYVCDKGYVQQHPFFNRSQQIYPEYELLPIFSAAKIKECNLDILMPSKFHFGMGVIQPYQIIPWKQKIFKAFWRGGLTDIDIYPNPSDIHFEESKRLQFVVLCNKLKNCNAAFSRLGKFGPTSDSAKFVASHWPFDTQRKSYRYQSQFKITVDLDGNSYSGRYPKMFGIKSAVFKIAAFDDIATIAMKPWLHFIPVKFDLSDFEQKLRWAENNDSELQLIANRGHEFSKKVHNQQVYCCYMKFLLLRYSELLEKGKIKLALTDTHKKHV